MSVISDELTKKCARDPVAINAVVITLRDKTSEAQRQAIRDQGAIPIAAGDTFWSGSFDSAALAALAALDGIDHIEEDQVMGAL